MLIGDECLAYLSYMVVSKHHGELDDISSFTSVLSGNDKNMGLLREQYESIDRGALQQILDDLKINFDILNYTTDEFLKDIDYLVSRSVKKSKKHDGA